MSYPKKGYIKQGRQTIELHKLSPKLNSVHGLNLPLLSPAQTKFGPALAGPNLLKTGYAKPLFITVYLSLNVG